jgi:hypothetical protein
MGQLAPEKFSWGKTADRETVIKERQETTPYDARCGGADKKRRTTTLVEKRLFT